MLLLLVVGWNNEYDLLSDCAYTDQLDSQQCSQLIDTLGCEHPHAQSYCAKSCLCPSSPPPPQSQPQSDSQSISISQLGSSSSVISSVPISYQTFPDGSYSGSYYFYGK